MGALMRSWPWDATPLGPPSGWPQSLRTAIGMMLESRFAMVVAWGPDFRFFYNDAYRQILGRTKHPAALGTPGAEIFPEVWEVVGPEFERVRRGESFEIEDWLLPLDRNGYLENCWFTLSYSPIRAEAGEVGGLLAVVAETTGRVEGERRLALLRELARATSDAKSPRRVCEIAVATFELDQLDVPFSLAYLLDEQGHAYLAACAGMTPGSAAAPNVVDIAAADPTQGWPLAAALDERALDVVTDLADRFPPLPGGAGQPEPAHSAVLLPLMRPGSAPYGVVIMGVSPRRALDDRYRAFYELAAEHMVAGIANALAYEEERKRAEALAELDRAKTAFFSNISHEFRTPLTLMLGPLEELLAHASSLSAQVRADVETAHRNALRLLKLVNSLLDFTRIEAGRVDALFEPTDLARLTTDLASVFRSAVERAGLRLVVACEQLPAPVFVDRELYEKIVLNLLSNALKFTFEGEIVVQLQPAGDFVELSVRDTGIGIPPDEQPFIFERFHRVQDARSRAHEGSGIGLALVRDLARLHGGDIRVESEPGRGSTFCVTMRTGHAHLPAAQVGSRADSTAIRPSAFVEEALRWLPDEEPPARQATVGARHARILVVDDNADMRAYITRLLEHDYEVDTAAHGEDALARIHERAPDLVLADVMMPRLDGFGLLAALRADPRTHSIPVVLLSARAGEESTVEGLRAGADDYLVKPFTARELLARVRTHIELVRTRAEVQERLLMAVTAERRRLAEIFEEAPAAIALLRGPDHVFEAANPAYRQVTGQREVIGRPVREAFPEVEGQGYFELLDQVYQTGEPYVGTEARVLFRDPEAGEETEYYFNFVYQPLREPTGEISGVFIHGIDVTPQVRARLEIDELYQRVRDANEAKAKFLAAVSHELRTPLNAVLGYAEILSVGVHGELQPDQVEDVERIQTASRYLLALINDILNFARVEAGQVDFRVRPIAAAELLERVRELVLLPLDHKGLAFAYTPPERTVSVLADWERAQQALLNLLTNAIKFTQPGGTVSLDCTVTESMLHIHVRDTGRGIAADELARIFDPFVQVDRAGISESQQGVGLGLTISRDLARKMGGDITAHSTPGQGSTFTLTLPLA